MSIWRMYSSAADGRIPYSVFRLVGSRITDHGLRITLFAVCVMFLALLTGCAGVDPVVKVGLVGPFEGEARAIGYDVIYSARLAVREVNGAGGIGGTRVALVALDDGGDPALARGAAAALAADPDVVAVVGHWLPETSAAATAVYNEAGLPVIWAGEPPLGAVDPASLPADFRAEYAAVTPFDETAGPYAGPAYDAFQLLWAALAAAEEEGGMGRTAVAEALPGLTIEGVTGAVYQPERRGKN